MSTAISLDFVSRDCRNGCHKKCYGKWEGMGFEIICACDCGHRIKVDTQSKIENELYFTKKSLHTESMVAPRDQSMRITPLSANWSDMNG